MNGREKILDVFSYNTTLKDLRCPNCEIQNMELVITNKSVGLRCGSCGKFYFYRRIENV